MREGAEVRVQAVHLVTVCPCFPLWWLPGLFISWVTVHLIFISERALCWFLTCTCKKILSSGLSLALKVANKVFIPKQALLVLDKKCNIREISSTEKQSSAKGKMFMLKVCHKI